MFDLAPKQPNDLHHPTIPTNTFAILYCTVLLPPFSPYLPFHHETSLSPSSSTSPHTLSSPSATPPPPSSSEPQSASIHHQQNTSLSTPLSTLSNLTPPTRPRSSPWPWSPAWAWGGPAWSRDACPPWNWNRDIEHLPEIFISVGLFRWLLSLFIYLSSFLILQSQYLRRANMKSIIMYYISFLSLSRLVRSPAHSMHCSDVHLMGPVRPLISTPLMKLKRVEPSFQGSSSSQDKFLPCRNHC